MRCSIGRGLWFRGSVCGGRLCDLATLYRVMRNCVLLCGVIDARWCLLMPSDSRKVLTLLVRSVSAGRSAVVIGYALPVLALMCAVQSLMCICMVGGTIHVSCSSHSVWALDSGVHVVV